MPASEHRVVADCVAVAAGAAETACVAASCSFDAGPEIAAAHDSVSAPQCADALGVLAVAVPGSCAVGGVFEVVSPVGVLVTETLASELPDGCSIVSQWLAAEPPVGIQASQTRAADLHAVGMLVAAVPEVAELTDLFFAGHPQRGQVLPEYGHLVVDAAGGLEVLECGCPVDALQQLELEKKGSAAAPAVVQQVVYAGLDLEWAILGDGVRDHREIEAVARESEC